MELIYVLEKNLKIVLEDSNLFLIAPEGLKGDKYNSNQLLIGFMKTIKLPVKILDTVEVEPTDGLVKVPLKTGKYKDYDKYIYLQNGKRIANISEEPAGILVNDTHIEENLNGGVNVNEIKTKREVASGNVNQDVRNFFIKTENGYDCRIYQLPKNIKKIQRVIYNSNILFINTSELVKKKYHVVVLNEELTGGVAFIHNKNARPGDKTYHLEYVFKAVEELLASELSGKWHVLNSVLPTVNEESGLLKVPLKIEQESIEKLLEY